MDVYTLRKRFPHLLPKEVVLWNKFLDVHQGDYMFFDYDVHVGRGVELPPDVDPMIRQIALGLSRKRIDVVGHKIDSVTLFEIKPGGGLSAIGQLMAYIYLYKIEYRKARKVVSRIISDHIDIDARNAARAYGINWTTIKIDWTKYEYDSMRRKYFLIP